MDADLVKLFDSYELSELERILEAMASAELYHSGMGGINGGYADAELYDIDYDGDSDENGDDFDLLMIEVESGEQDMGQGWSKSTRQVCTLDRRVLKMDLTLREKIEKVKW